MNRRPISREALLTPNWLLVHDGFSLPTVGQIAKEGYQFTRETYRYPNSRSPMYAIDCEMCFTREGLELTKIAMVDEQHVPMLVTLVKPDNPIVDYLTEYSGVSPNMLEGVTTRLQDVQEILKNILPEDAILVGHSLTNDLKALKLYHPFIIDTSIVFRTRNNRKRKLRDLVAEHLGKEIQTGSSGHCPLEDSSAALELIQFRLRKPPPCNGIYNSYRATSKMLAAGNVDYFKIQNSPAMQHCYRSSEGVQESTDRNYIGGYEIRHQHNNKKNLQVQMLPVLDYIDEYGVQHCHRSTEMYFEIQNPPNVNYGDRYGVHYQHENATLDGNTSLCEGGYLVDYPLEVQGYNNLSYGAHFNNGWRETTYNHISNRNCDYVAGTTYVLVSDRGSIYI